MQYTAATQSGRKLDPAGKFDHQKHRRKLQNFYESPNRQPKRVAHGSSKYITDGFKDVSIKAGLQIDRLKTSNVPERRGRVQASLFAEHLLAGNRNTMYNRMSFNFSQKSSLNR